MAQVVFVHAHVSDILTDWYVFPLARAAEAYARVEAGGLRGKVVLAMEEEDNSETDGKGDSSDEPDEPPERGKALALSTASGNLAMMTKLNI